VTRRFTGLLAASMFSAVMVLATACTSNGGSPDNTHTTSQSVRLSPRQIEPLFFKCLVEHNVPIWDKSQGDQNLVSLAKTEGWYENGRVLANNDLYTYADVLEGFYPISPDFKPDQTIGTWIDNASTTGTWPKVCGRLPPGR
jgi:hypothetical protein